MANVLTAVDTIHKYVNNIPPDDSSIDSVYGYDTQVGPNADIKWSPEDWARFPNYIKKVICQLPADDPLAADIIDSETGAAGIQEVLNWVHGKHMRKEIAVVYIQASNVTELSRALISTKELDQTYLSLANWNLDEAEAAALLGTEYEGIPVVSVQWASPSSNPNTFVPGTNYTLADAGCDLNVAHVFPVWREPAKHLVSVVAVATYSDGSKKSWSV